VINMQRPLNSTNMKSKLMQHLGLVAAVLLVATQGLIAGENAPAVLTALRVGVCANSPPMIF
jgi:hypothetical protein